MPHHVHLDSLTCQRLLGGELDQGTASEMEEHVVHCDSCRQQLEQMAAEPHWWQKAATLLAEETLIEPFPAMAGDSPAVELDDDDDATAFFSLNAVLDAPSHPEMLGRLDDYEIEREIGRGGMGVVFKAFDRELNRPLAIKIMAPHLASIGAARKRFAREARAAAAVLHPNVIAIHGVNSNGRLPYIVMPYVSGCSLEELVMRSGPLDEIDIVRIALQIAAGLSAAHLQGLVHRDIKPANILIENSINRVLITDFGLARAEDDASMTQTGWFAGTPNFMSPEQARGQFVDQRSDLFSLGSVIYFMATGRLPFRADGPMAVLDRIRGSEPAAVREVNPDISITLETLIERLLEKSPDDRFQTAAELHQVLEQLLAHKHRPTISTAPKLRKRSARRSRRLSRYGAMALMCITPLVLWLLAGVWLSPEPESIPDPFQSIADQYGLIADDELLGELQAVAAGVYRLEQSNTGVGNGLMSDTRFVQELLAIDQQLNQLSQVLEIPDEITDQTGR